MDGLNRLRATARPVRGADRRHEWSAASRPTRTFAPSRVQTLDRVRKRIADADVKVLDVVDGFLQQSGDMAVVEPVDDVAPAAVAGHQANVAQEPELVGDGGLFHSYRGR